MKTNSLPYHLLALSVVAVWGVTFVCTKTLLVAGLRPADIFAIRFLLAYAGIWALCLFGWRTANNPGAQEQSASNPDVRGTEGPSREAGEGSGRRSGLSEARLFSDNWKDELMFLFLGVTGGSLYFITENSALSYTQAANVSFLVCVAPLFTAIFTLIGRKVLRGRFADGLEDVKVGFPLVGGTVLALVGMAMVVFDGARMEISVRGDLLSIAAALCWALYSVFMGQMTNDYGAVFATRKVFFYGLLTIIPVLFLQPGAFSPEILARPQVYLNLLFLGLVASLACFIGWNVAMARLGNVTATNYVYLNPIFTLITAAVILGERMSPFSLVGCAAILAGVILAGRRG